MGTDPSGTLDSEESGTPEVETQDGGASGSQAGGAGGESEVDWKAKALEAEERAKQINEKRLSELAALENERKRRQELEAAQAAPPTGGAPDPVSQAVDALNRAAMGEYVDPQIHAQAILVIARAQAQQNEMYRIENEISRLPDETGKAVRSYMQQGFPLEAAKKAARADELEARAAKWDETEKERKAREEAQRKQAEEEVVSTAVKPVPAADLRARTMTTEEYSARLTQLLSSDPQKARELKARREAGLLRLKD